MAKEFNPDTDLNLATLPPEYMLAALFNAASPVGMGLLAALSAPQVISIEEAKAAIAEHSQVLRTYEGPYKTWRSVRFDYLHGRPIKVEFVEVEKGVYWCRRCDLFDRDNGKGAARAAFDNAVAAFTSRGIEQEKQTVDMPEWIPEPNAFLKSEVERLQRENSQLRQRLSKFIKKEQNAERSPSAFIDRVYDQVNADMRKNLEKLLSELELEVRRAKT